MEQIILYTTHCPACRVLERRLSEAHISYEVNEDVREMRRLGISHLPVLSVNGKLMQMREALDYLDGEARA